MMVLHRLSGRKETTKDSNTRTPENHTTTPLFPSLLFSPLPAASLRQAPRNERENDFKLKRTA